MLDEYIIRLCELLIESRYARRTNPKSKRERATSTSSRTQSLPVTPVMLWRPKASKWHELKILHTLTAVSSYLLLFIVFKGHSCFFDRHSPAESLTVCATTAITATSCCDTWFIHVTSLATPLATVPVLPTSGRRALASSSRYFCNTIWMALLTENQRARYLIVCTTVQMI